MPNILLLSQNENFANDLSEQIHLYAPDFNVSQYIDDRRHLDVIIVDEDVNVAAEIHEKQIKVPVFVLTSNDAKGTNTNFVHEFIAKPFSLAQFLEQLKSCISIYENSCSGYLHFGNYILKPIKKEIFNTKTNQTVKLTEKEVSIIKYLYKSQDKIISKNELLQYVWGYSPDVTTHTLETHIYRLRQKVEQNSTNEPLIITSEGGYKLII